MPHAPHSPVGQTRTGGERDGHTGRAARPGRRRLRGRIAIGGLAAVVAVFLVLNVPLAYDPALSRLPLAKFPFYFPLLVGHVTFATVAIATCVLQVWPWLRHRHPRVHRNAGRVYVASVWPTALSVIVISVAWPFGPVEGLSDVVHALMWVAATTYGFMLARQGRFADHRRWMLRSFALVMSNILNRIIGPLIGVIYATQLHTTFHGSHLVESQAVSASTSWLCWTVALIAMEWWLDGERRRTLSSRDGPARDRADPQPDDLPTGDRPVLAQGPHPDVVAAIAD